MTREKILQTFSDINHVYNNSTKYDTLKRMLDELTESCEDCNSRKAVMDALEGEAYRAGVKYVVDKLRSRLYYVPGGWKKASPENRMIFDSIERALDECAEYAQIGGDE